MKLAMRGLVLCCPVVLAAALVAQPNAGSPAGAWEGDFVCQVPKPCITEHVVYEIKQNAAGNVDIAADKVVNGGAPVHGNAELHLGRHVEETVVPGKEYAPPGGLDLHVTRRHIDRHSDDDR